MFPILIATLVFSVVLAFVLGALLGVFREFFRVDRDPLIDEVRAALPGANCGGCGYPGCEGYAEAVAMKVAGPSLCTAGGKETAEKLVKLVGGEAKMVDTDTILLCQGSCEAAPLKGEYTGLKSCRAVKLTIGNTKLCSYGCIGYGDCVSVCKFDALKIGPNCLPVVDILKCTGCGMCVLECPNHLFVRIENGIRGAIPLCSNRNPVKANIIKTCKHGCIKCEACIRACQYGALVMKDGIPVVDYSKCTSCKACVDKCPTKVFKLLEQGLNE